MILMHYLLLNTEMCLSKNIQANCKHVCIIMYIHKDTGTATGVYTATLRQCMY